MLAPDLHVSDDELVLTLFVTPQQGFQAGSPNPETPARVALAHSVHGRRLVDGALYDAGAMIGGQALAAS